MSEFFPWNLGRDIGEEAAKIKGDIEDDKNKIDETLDWITWIEDHIGFVLLSIVAFFMLLFKFMRNK